MSPEDTRPVDALFNCIFDIKSWMAENVLQLNQDKTEVSVVGPEARRENHLSKLQALSLKPSERVKNLGVTVDSELSFIPHVKHVVKSGFYHLKKSQSPPNPLSSQHRDADACFIDYCDALLCGLPKRSISHVHLLQNSAC